MKRNDPKLALVPPLYERRWAEWRSEPRPFERPEDDHKLHLVDVEVGTSEAAFITKYLDLADTLLATDNDAADEDDFQQDLPRAA